MIERKKILITEPNVAQLVTDMYDEELSSPNEVLVKAHYSHISTGTELACISGTESFFSIPGTPGYTAVGEIIKMGNNVKGFKVGDMIFTYGPHAAYFKIDITDRWHGVCVKLPSTINPEYAVFTHMGNIAMTALRKSNIELGDTILITGLGAIGNLVSQLCQLQGATVIASDINEKRIQIADACGIQKTTNSSISNLKEFVEKETKHEMVSTYIDASGISKVIEASIDCLALNGETILLGSPRVEHKTDITKFLQSFHLLPWNHNLKGALEFTYPTHETNFNKHSIERNAKIIMNLILQEKLQIKPIYTHKIKPDHIQSAYEGLRNNPEVYIGVVIDWKEK